MSSFKEARISLTASWCAILFCRATTTRFAWSYQAATRKITDLETTVVKVPAERTGALLASYVHRHSIVYKLFLGMICEIWKKRANSRPEKKCAEDMFEPICLFVANNGSVMVALLSS